MTSIARDSMVHVKMCKTVILLSFLVTQGYALQSGLFLVNSGCACPGHSLIFECVINGTGEGTTLWKGAALQDECMSLQQDVHLLHRQFESGIAGVMECSGSTIIAWRTLGVENNFYISQLNITYSTDLIGKAVVCAYDDLKEENIIGSWNISINNLTSYPPPSGIRLEKANEEYLTFAWDSVVPECTAIHYIITSTDCGKCPDTTIHNSAICNEFSASTIGTLCVFAIQTEFCPGNIMYQTIGDVSSQYYVTLKVPEAPTVDAIIFRYSYLTKITTGFVVQFNAIPSFIYNGLNGSIVSYTLAYNNPVSGISCESATVPVSSCVDGICRHLFTYEGSGCSSPSIGVNVSLSAANILGSGPAASYPSVVQESINTFLSVSLNIDSNHALCTFHGRQTVSMKTCSINYWLKVDECCISKGVTVTQYSYSTLNDVIIGLPSSSLSNGQYCFNVMGNNGTYATILEGTFNINDKDTQVSSNNQATNQIILGLSLALVISVSIIIVAVLILIIFFLLRVCKRIQVDRVNVHTPALSSSTPVSTESTRVALKPSSDRVYEELDGNDGDSGEIDRSVSHDNITI